VTIQSDVMTGKRTRAVHFKHLGEVYYVEVEDGKNAHLFIQHKSGTGVHRPTSWVEVDVNNTDGAKRMMSEAFTMATRALRTI